jgi:oxygen-independent coproporphyrinogen-3 oxidase
MVPNDTPPPWIWPRAAYVHIPFCAHHCGYCDFAVVTGQDHRIDLYLEALGAELTTLGSPQPVDTLFLGGGTPTYLNCRQLESLLVLLTRWLPLQPGHEFSIEANPGTFDADKVAVLADHGVNRVSLGAQSFHPHLLRVLERDHAPQDVLRSVEVARKRIPHISLDLIFGAPGQSTIEWQTDLDRALALEPGHLSTYGLTYEKGTRLWKQKGQGSVQPLDEEAELAMYVMAMTKLQDSGFEHCEISSFARSGERCRHNQVYWANEAYFGFGLGAARYVEGRREHNTRDLQNYLKKTLSGESATFQTETLQPEERARETMSLNLRRANGIAHKRFREQTGFDVDTIAGEAIRRHVDLGLLHDDGTSVRFTPQGKCVADTVIENLLKVDAV